MATTRCIYYRQNPAFAIAPHVNPNHHPQRRRKFRPMSSSEYEPESDPPSDTSRGRKDALLKSTLSRLAKDGDNEDVILPPGHAPPSSDSSPSSSFGNSNSI